MKVKLRCLAVCIFLLLPFFVSGEVYKENAVVSYYGEDFNGKKTSSGETFSMYQMTCASKNLPFDTELKVTNLANKKSVIVRVNDRGPFVAERELDLSKAAAIKLDMIKTGTAHVKIEIIKMGPDTKLSRQTAASAAKIMAKKTGKSTNPGSTTVKANGSVKIDASKIYDFQMGAFSSKDNAKALASKLKKDGFTGIVFQTTTSGIVRVVIKAVPGSEVDALKNKLSEKGYKDFQVKPRLK